MASSFLYAWGHRPAVLSLPLSRMQPTDSEIKPTNVIDQPWAVSLLDDFQSSDTAATIQWEALTPARHAFRMNAPSNSHRAAVGQKSKDLYTHPRESLIQLSYPGNTAVANIQNQNLNIDSSSLSRDSQTQQGNYQGSKLYLRGGHSTTTCKMYGHLQLSTLGKNIMILWT